MKQMPAKKTKKTINLSLMPMQRKLKKIRRSSTCHQYLEWTIRASYSLLLSLSTKTRFQLHL